MLENSLVHCNGVHISWHAYYSEAISGLAGWALAHLEFGSSVNPIPTMGADYAHHKLLANPDMTYQHKIASV